MSNEHQNEQTENAAKEANETPKEAQATEGEFKVTVRKLEMPVRPARRPRRVGPHSRPGFEALSISAFAALAAKQALVPYDYEPLPLAPRRRRDRTSPTAASATATCTSSTTTGRGARTRLCRGTRSWAPSSPPGPAPVTPAGSASGVGWQRVGLPRVRPVPGGTREPVPAAGGDVRGPHGGLRRAHPPRRALRLRASPLARRRRRRPPALRRSDRVRAAAAPGRQAGHARWASSASGASGTSPCASCGALGARPPPSRPRPTSATRRIRLGAASRGVVRRTPARSARTRAGSTCCSAPSRRASTGSGTSRRSAERGPVPRGRAPRADADPRVAVSPGPAHHVRQRHRQPVCHPRDARVRRRARHRRADRAPPMVRGERGASSESARTRCVTGWCSRPPAVSLQRRERDPLEPTPRDASRTLRTTAASCAAGTLARVRARDGVVAVEHDLRSFGHRHAPRRPREPLRAGPSSSGCRARRRRRPPRRASRCGKPEDHELARELGHAPRRAAARARGGCTSRRRG